MERKCGHYRKIPCWMDGIGFCAKPRRAARGDVVVPETFRKAKEKLLQEARRLADFADEPGIVQVLDYFEAHWTAYIVMEFLDGKTLGEWFQQRGQAGCLRISTIRNIWS